MTDQRVKTNFFYITFQVKQSYKCVKITASNTIEAIRRFNRIYTGDCFLVSINSTQKVLPGYIENLIMTLHPN